MSKNVLPASPNFKQNTPIHFLYESDLENYTDDNGAVIEVIAEYY